MNVPRRVLGVQTWLVSASSCKNDELLRARIRLTGYVLGFNFILSYKIGQTSQKGVDEQYLVGYNYCLSRGMNKCRIT
jgi:hypothetical protein